LIINARSFDENSIEGFAGIGFSRRGTFPKFFCQKLDLPLDFYASRFILTEKSSVAVEKMPQQGNFMKAKVTNDLLAKLPEEISLNSGETVYIEKFIDKFYCQGFTADRTRRGIFPKNFVEIETDNETSTHQDNDLNKSLVDNFGIDNKPPTSSLYANELKNSPCARVKFDFNAEYPEELAVKTGETVNLIRYVDDEWILGNILN